MKTLVNLLFIILFFQITSLSQTDFSLDQTKPNHFDFSDQFMGNIEVKVWGIVNNTGIYKINKGTRLIELLTFTGGLKENVELDKIRIVRLKDSLSTGDNEVIVINYEDIFESDNLRGTVIKNPELKNGDIIVTTTKTSWINDLAPIITVISAITSLATLAYLFIRFK